MWLAPYCPVQLKHILTAWPRVMYFETKDSRTSTNIACKKAQKEKKKSQLKNSFSFAALRCCCVLSLKATESLARRVVLFCAGQKSYPFTI